MIIPYRFDFYNFNIFETDACRDLNTMSEIFVKIIKLGRRIECFHFNIWICLVGKRDRRRFIMYFLKKKIISFSSRKNMTEFIYRFQFFNKMFELLVESSIVEQKETGKLRLCFIIPQDWRSLICRYNVEFICEASVSDVFVF